MPGAISSRQLFSRDIFGGKPAQLDFKRNQRKNTSQLRSAPLLKVTHF